jgi:hypothetical protein
MLLSMPLFEATMFARIGLMRVLNRRVVSRVADSLT